MPSGEARIERGEVEQFSVKQVRGPHIGHGADHGVLAAGHALLDVVEHRLHGVALQPFLAAAEVARDDREFHGTGEFLQIHLGAISERAQNHDVALVIDQLRRHGCETAAMEEIHEEGLEDILAVVAENQGGAPLLARDAVEIAAPEPRAERAIGAALGQLVGDHRIGILVLDAVRDAVGAEIVRQDVFRVIRLALVEIAGKQLDRQQAAPFEVEQQGKQAIGILAARERNQPALAGLHHGEVFDRLAGEPQEPLAQLVELDRGRHVAKQRMKAALFLAGDRFERFDVQQHVHDAYAHGP